MSMLSWLRGEGKSVSRKLRTTLVDRFSHHGHGCGGVEKLKKALPKTSIYR